MPQMDNAELWDKIASHLPWLRNRRPPKFTVNDFSCRNIQIPLHQCGQPESYAPPPPVLKNNHTTNKVNIDTSMPSDSIKSLEESKTQLTEQIIPLDSETKEESLKITSEKIVSPAFDSVNENTKLTNPDQNPSSYLGRSKSIEQKETQPTKDDLNHSNDLKLHERQRPDNTSVEPKKHVKNPDHTTTKKHTQQHVNKTTIHNYPDRSCQPIPSHKDLPKWKPMKWISALVFVIILVAYPAYNNHVKPEPTAQEHDNKDTPKGSLSEKCITAKKVNKNGILIATIKTSCYKNGKYKLYYGNREHVFYLQTNNTKDDTEIKLDLYKGINNYSVKIETISGNKKRVDLDDFKTVFDNLIKMSVAWEESSNVELVLRIKSNAKKPLIKVVRHEKTKIIVHTLIYEEGKGKSFNLQVACNKKTANGNKVLYDTYLLSANTQLVDEPHDMEDNLCQKGTFERETFSSKEYGTWIPIN